MKPGLARVLQVLRDHREELRGPGVRYASIFGSVARGENRPDRDVDVLIELDREHAMGLLEY